MKTIKLNYAGVSEDFDKTQNLIYDVLVNAGYDVQIVEDPDYVVCGFSENRYYEYCASPQVRIMYSGENYIPDFNLIDYAISPYPISFGDRHFQLPACVWPQSHWFALSHRERGGVFQRIFSRASPTLPTSSWGMNRNLTSGEISSRSCLPTSGWSRRVLI